MDYNEFGQMSSVTRGNGVVTSYEYDVKGRVTNLLSTNDANGIPTALQNVNYTFNVANSITAIENTPEMDPQGGYHSTIRYSYRYDGLNRLVHSTGFYQRSMNGFEVTEPPKKFELAYGYAQNGNMLHKEVRNPESHTLEDRWNYGYSNHSVTGIDSTLHGADRFYMQYDAAGNMIRQADNSKNLIKEMQYDSNNRIKTVTNPSNGETVGQYWYDDQGFRVHKISRREVEGEMKEHELLYTSKYMGIEIQKDNEGGEIQNSYAIVNNIYMNGVRIAAVVPGGNALHYLTDQVDSVKVVVNDSGLPVSRMEYMPYGETWFQEGEENHTPKYNSQELDKETGYYFYNARYYDPEIARFVTADNVVDGQFDTQGWNRFSYVKGNPILYKDPTGHEIVDGRNVSDGPEGNSGKVIEYGTGKIISDGTSNVAAKAGVEGKLQQAKDSNTQRAANDKPGKDPARSPNVTYLDNGARYPLREGSYTVGSEFGMRKNPLNPKKQQFHSGQDLPTVSGNDVSAVSPGRVILNTKTKTGGNTLEIDHGTDAKGNRITSKTLHSDENKVKEGEVVREGQRTAVSGNTGRNTTGSHVHFEVRRNGEAVDPRTFNWNEVKYNDNKNN